MSDKKQSTQQAPPPTIITLTLPTPSESSIPLERATATLLIQRGDLAHVRQFTYHVLEDLTMAIKQAYLALAAVEAEPPIIPELPPAAPKSEPKTQAKGKAAAEPVVEEEPTIDVPLKKGTLAVKISYLKIVGGETDAAAYRQAVLIAGRLIDGKLWDGQSPIHIEDVYAVAKKLKPMTDKDLSLFVLTDFVQIGGATDAAADIKADIKKDAVEPEDDSIATEPLLMTTISARNGKTFSTKEQHPDDAAAE